MKSAPKKHTNSNMDLAVAKCFNEVTKMLLLQVYWSLTNPCKSSRNFI